MKMENLKYRFDFNTLILACLLLSLSGCGKKQESVENNTYFWHMFYLEGVVKEILKEPATNDLTVTAGYVVEVTKSGHREKSLCLFCLHEKMY